MNSKPKSSADCVLNISVYFTTLTDQGFIIPAVPFTHCTDKMTRRLKKVTVSKARNRTQVLTRTGLMLSHFTTLPFSYRFINYVLV